MFFSCLKNHKQMKLTEFQEEISKLDESKRLAILALT